MQNFRPQVNYIYCDNKKEQYRMMYSSWGTQENSEKTLICLHGLNRNNRDWDFIAEYFASHGYYVIAPDLVGHGNSDYLRDYSGYDIPYYVADVINLIKILQLRNINVIGTSFGGIVGMIIATQGIVQKLVLNDIGAEVASNGVARIASNNMNLSEFDNYDLARERMLERGGEFAILPEDVCEHFMRNSFQKNALGKYQLKRDLNIIRQMASTTPVDKNFELWPYWEKVKIPTLVIRGELSDILSVDTIARMQQTNAKTESIEIKGVGHAPFLYSSEHSKFLTEFFVKV